jgi:hypothetical protein
MSLISIVADQVLYGWAEKKGRSGYQFITQSSSLSEEDFSYIEKYSIPIGLNNIAFKESRRLLTLPSGKVAMNYVKNIGKDIHGRDGALMSHFLIFDFKNFVEARKNLEELDRHHLKGIASVKDIEKLKLANGNFMQLPVVNIEIDVNDQSYGEELISDKNREFSRDALYGIFLNIFQSQIKIGVISTDITTMFRQIMTLESLFPPWIVLTYSTGVISLLFSIFLHSLKILVASSSLLLNIFSFAYSHPLSLNLRFSVGSSSPPIISTIILLSSGGIRTFLFTNPFFTCVMRLYIFF